MTGEYSWIDGVGTRHVVEYRADETGYHVLDMRQEKNVVKIREKPRKQKKNGSRKAKITAFRAAKLAERGGRFKVKNNGETPILKPVTEKTSTFSVKKSEIPELVRSFRPQFENNFESTSSVSLNNPTHPNPTLKTRSKEGSFNLRPTPAVPINDFVIRNRKNPKPEIDLVELTEAFISSSDHQKSLRRNNIIRNRPILNKIKTPGLNILDLIPVSDEEGSGNVESDVNNPNSPSGRAQLTDSKTNFLDLIPISEQKTPKTKGKNALQKETIEYVTLPPITSPRPRPRIHLSLLTKNEREKVSPSTHSGLKTGSKQRLKNPNLISSTGKPPIVISTTNQPVSTNIPNPIFNNKNIENSLAEAQRKKEEEIIAQLKRQLYEVLGQKRKLSKSKASASNPNQFKSKGKKELKDSTLLFSQDTQIGTKPTITNFDLAGILSNLGISAPVPDVINDNSGALEDNNPLKKSSKSEKNKRKRVRIVKSRPRTRKPSPQFANFDLADINKDKNGKGRTSLLPETFRKHSSLNTASGISDLEIRNRKNPNRKRKLLRVIKKLRPKKLRGFKLQNKASDSVKAKENLNSVSPKSSVLPNQNKLLTEHSAVNTVANKVLLQAVLETENNVGGDVEESVRSQVVITPRGLRKPGITISRVEKVGPKANTPKISSTFLEATTPKITLPAPGSIKLKQAEIRRSDGSSSRTLYTLPPRVLSPIGFAHPPFSLLSNVIKDTE